MCARRYPSVDLLFHGCAPSFDFSLAELAAAEHIPGAPAVGRVGALLAIAKHRAARKNDPEPPGQFVYDAHRSISIWSWPSSSRVRCGPETARWASTWARIWPRKSLSKIA